MPEVKVPRVSSVGMLNGDKIRPRSQLRVEPPFFEVRRHGRDDTSSDGEHRRANRHPKVDRELERASMRTGSVVSLNAQPCPIYPPVRHAGPLEGQKQREVGILHHGVSHSKYWEGLGAPVQDAG